GSPDPARAGGPALAPPAPPATERKTTTRAIPAAAVPITARIAAVPAAAPAKSGSTGRVPAAQPSNGRATQSMRPATQRMGAATQRLGAATTRRMPSRTTGRIKKTGGFSMPTTRKGKIIAVCVALGVVGAIGALAFFYSIAENPAKVKEELA